MNRPMPDARLERTRRPHPVVPPCVRLGHAWREYVETAELECLRCRLRLDALRADLDRRVGMASYTPR